MQIVLVSASAHEEKIAELLEAAQRTGVPVKRVYLAALAAFFHR